LLIAKREKCTRKQIEGSLLSRNSKKITLLMASSSD